MCLRHAALKERQLEAVYISFCLYGKWDAAAMVVPHKCNGMKENSFLALCRTVGLVDDFRASPENLRAVHREFRSKVGAPVPITSASPPKLSAQKPALLPPATFVPKDRDMCRVPLRTRLRCWTFPDSF